MSRHYKIGKEKYPSVTTIIGDYDTGGLMQWAANCAVDYIKENFEAFVNGEDWNKARYAYKEISKEAAGIGTEVHDLAEQLVKAYIKPPPQHDTPSYVDYTKMRSEVEQGYDAFCRWVTDVDPEFIASELTVHSSIHKYAGTLDCVCKLDGKLYVVDFKTSKAHYPKNAVQLAAYKMAYEEMTGLTVDGVAVLRLDKVTGEYDWKDYTKVVDRQWLSFLGLLQTWNNYKKRRL